MKPITLYGGLARIGVRKDKATIAWRRLQPTRRNARRWRRFCHWEREALKLKDAEDRFWTKHIKAECPDSPTGKHNFTPDWEYDHTGQTINCEYCGEEQPNPEKDKKTMNQEQAMAALFESAKETATEILKRGEEPLPIALALDTDGAPCAIKYDSTSREAMQLCLTAIAKRFPVFITINTAWVAPGKDVERYGYPEACPNRKQGVMVQAFSSEKLLATSVLMFEEKAGGGFTFGDWEDTDMQRTEGSIFPG